MVRRVVELLLAKLHQIAPELTPLQRGSMVLILAARDGSMTVVGFLAGESASWVTGQTIRVNGGMA